MLSQAVKKTERSFWLCHASYAIHSIAILGEVFNVLPMTFLRYGYVSNHRPVVTR
jgi:hypothetical protein